MEKPISNAAVRISWETAIAMILFLTIQSTRASLEIGTARDMTIAIVHDMTFARAHAVILWRDRKRGVTRVTPQG